MKNKKCQKILFKNGEQSLKIVLAMEHKLERYHPQCASNMKQLKKNMERTYKILDSREGRGEENKMRDIQKDYGVFYQQAVDCWLASRAAKKAAAAAKKP